MSSRPPRRLSTAPSPRQEAVLALARRVGLTWSEGARQVMTAARARSASSAPLSSTSAQSLPAPASAKSLLLPGLAGLPPPVTALPADVRGDRKSVV